MAHQLIHCCGITIFWTIAQSYAWLKISMIIAESRDFCSTFQFLAHNVDLRPRFVWYYYTIDRSIRQPPWSLKVLMLDRFSNEKKPLKIRRESWNRICGKFALSSVHDELYVMVVPRIGDRVNWKSFLDVPYYRFSPIWWFSFTAFCCMPGAACRVGPMFDWYFTSFVLSLVSGSVI